jgi:predicted permease
MLSDLLYRLRALFRRESVETEMDDELRFHLERQAEKYVKSGMTRAEATRRARLEFGGTDQVKEECRDARGVRLLETLVQDIRYGLRMLAKNPGFTAVAVLTLALGIGANTAVFSLVDAIMVQKLPVHKPDELVQIASVNPSSTELITNGFSYTAYQDFRRNRQAFTDLFAFTSDTMNFRFGGSSERVAAEMVSGSYYSTLGVKALLGRTIQEEDDRTTGGNSVAVLSCAFWRRRFGSDPSILGKAVFLGDTAFTVVGITPPEFFGLSRGRSVDVYVPMRTVASQLDATVLTDPEAWWLSGIIGRLKPGYTTAQAQAELELPFRRFLDAQTRVRTLWPASDGRAFFTQKVGLLPAARGLYDLRWEFSDQLHILIAVVGLVLLIACANTATLLLARATARQQEMVVRLALGAGRRRLMQQLLTESLLLSLSGGSAGLLVGAWAHRALMFCLFRNPSSTYLAFQIDQRVLGFTLAVSFFTGIVFGVLPALHATQVELSPLLKAGGRAAVGAAGMKPAKALLVFQVAASLLLLVTTGLFLRTLRNLQKQNPGFSQENVLLMRIDPGPRYYTRATTLETYRKLLERLSAIPGVDSAALASNFVFGAGGWWKTVWVEGHDYSPNEDQMAGNNDVSPGFFRTVGVPLLLGREFDSRDHSGSPLVVIVNEAFVRRYFARVNPIGRHLGDNGPTSRGKYEIVGVVANSKYGSLRDHIFPTVYQCIFQTPEDQPAVLHVRTKGNPEAFAAGVPKEIRNLNPDFVVFDVRTLAEQVSSSLHQERVFAVLTAVFGALALLLACIGIYGVVAYSVVSRTSEIGIRVALGAKRVQILWMVLREVLALAAGGLAAGVAACFASGRIIANQLFGLKPADPETMLVASLALAMVAALSAYLPARRATKVDPMVALRYE